MTGHDKKKAAPADSAATTAPATDAAK